VKSSGDFTLKKEKPWGVGEQQPGLKGDMSTIKGLGDGLPNLKSEGAATLRPAGAEKSCHPRLGRRGKGGGNSSPILKDRQATAREKRRNVKRCRATSLCPPKGRGH